MATNANCRQNETTPRNYAQQKRRNILNSYIALRQRSPQTRRLEAFKDLPGDNFFAALATYPRRAPTAPPNMMPPPSLYSSKTCVSAMRRNPGQRAFLVYGKLARALEFPNLVLPVKLILPVKKSVTVCRFLQKPHTCFNSFKGSDS